VGTEDNHLQGTKLNSAVRQVLKRRMHILIKKGFCSGSSLGRYREKEFHLLWETFAIRESRDRRRPRQKRGKEKVLMLIND